MKAGKAKRWLCAFLTGAVILGEMAGTVGVQAAQTTQQTVSENTAQTQDLLRAGAANIKTTALVPGTDRASASAVSLNTPVSASLTEKQEGLVTQTQRTHWYKFTVTQPGMVSVTFSHPQMDADTNLAAWTVDFHVAEDGTSMVSKTSNAYQTSMQTVPVAMAAGEYYIRVDGQALVTKTGDSYTMTINYTQAACETEPNNSIAKANVLTSGREVAGSIYATSDKADYYKINMADAGYVTAEFDYDLINADSATDSYSVSLVKIDAGGNEENLFTKTANADTPHLTFAKTGLPAGSYYMKVTKAVGALEYQNAYRIKAVWKASSKWEQESNDSIKKANPVTSGTEYQGSIHKLTDTDYYKVNLTGQGYISVSMEHAASADLVYQLALLDADGNVLVSKTSSANEAATKLPQFGTAKGTYYVRVSGTNTESNYQIKAVCKTSSKWESENNDTRNAANSIKSGTKYEGNLYKLTDTDYYKVSLTGQGYISVSMEHAASADLVYQLALLDADGNVLVSKTGSANETSMALPKMGAEKGTYYVRVTGTNTKDNYQLKVTCKSSSQWELENNDTKNAANTAETGTTYGGSLSSISDVDYYRVKVPGNGYVQFTLSYSNGKQNEAITASVYDENETELYTCSTEGMDGTIKSGKIGVASGTYYIKVSGVTSLNNLTNTGYSGTYKLKVTAKKASGYETEPNTKQDNSDRITVGKAVTGVSQSLADYDWYRFTLDNAAYVNLSIAHNKINSDYAAWYATLYDGDGVRVKDGTKNIYVNAYAKDTYAESGMIKLKAGTYYVRVQAQSRIALDQEYKLTVNKIGTPKAKITEIESSYNKLKVKWSVVPGATKYVIYRSTSKNGTYTKVKTIENTSTTSWTDKNVETGKTYYYKMKVTVKTSKSKTSKYSEVKSAKATLAQVAAKAKASGSKALKVSWEKVSGAQGYEVYRSTSKDGKFKKVTSITKGSTQSYTDKKLAKGKTYYYKVRAYRTVNGRKVYGSYSNIVSATVK